MEGDTMSERDDNELRELGWRRKLAPAEQALLQRHRAQRPEAQAEWEAEAALTHLLDRLPDVPLASNFTAQVLHAVERESLEPVSRGGIWEAARARLSPLLPHLAWSVGLIAAILLVWQRYEVAQHERMLAGVASVLQAATLPEPQDVMQDFEVIQQLDQLPPARDLELLTALSQ
jgi:hypothetical protein